MSGLMMAETERFVSRRITRFFPLVLAVLFVVGAVIAYSVVRAEDASIDFVGDLASFGRTAAQGPIANVEQPENATAILGPLGLLLPIMAFTLGASFYGADQKNGVIELLLTWQPHRSKFLGTRAVVGALVTTVIAIALSAFFVAVMWGLSSVAGTTDGMTVQMWGWIAMAVVRSGIASGLFFLLGLGLTVLLNNSTASIIVFMIYAFVIENLLQAFLGWLAPWLPMTNAGSYVSATSVAVIDVFGDTPAEFHHGYLTAGLITLAYSLVAVIAGFVVFQRRDIT
ncbi:MAG: ABC transporter permease subunit [Acidimicrobiia bacterium]|nr:ABC transporter permease subunit [Acidimicrobiia bacterium]